MSSAANNRSSRHKRQRPSKNKDDDTHEPYTTPAPPADARSLADDTRSDTHSRMYHASSHDDGYRASKRGRYESKDSGSSSRWRQPPEDDAYAYGRDDYRDDYHTRGRDDPGYHGSRYAPPSRAWYPDYVQGPSSPPISVRESWPAEPAYDETYGWTPDASNSRRSDDRRDSGDAWRRKPRKDEGDKKFTSDAGWDTKRRSREEQKRPDPQPEEDRARAWEPAPSWKSAHNGELYEERMRSIGVDPKLAKHKSKNKKNKQKRVRESGGVAGEDDDLNNWTKRDNRSAAGFPSPSHSRKHHRSKSPMRSSSYDELYGRPRARSLSRSATPPPPSKRARHDRGYDDERGRPRKVVYERPSSPGNSRLSPPRRRRSLSSRSSRSSRSRSRSRSISPYARPRALHRLPTSSTPAVSPPVNSKGIALTDTPPRHKRNGKHQANGKSNKQRKVNDEPPFPSRDALLSGRERSPARESVHMSSRVREPLPQSREELPRSREQEPSRAHEPEPSKESIQPSSNAPAQPPVKAVVQEPPRAKAQSQESMHAVPKAESTLQDTHQLPNKESTRPTVKDIAPLPAKGASPIEQPSLPAVPLPLKPVKASSTPELNSASAKTKVPLSANLPPKPQISMAPPFKAGVSPQPMVVEAAKSAGDSRPASVSTVPSPDASQRLNSPAISIPPPQPVQSPTVVQQNPQATQAAVIQSLPAQVSQAHPPHVPMQLPQTQTPAQSHPLPQNPSLVHPYAAVQAQGLPQRPVLNMPYMYGMPGMPAMSFGMPGMPGMPNMPGMPGYPAYPFPAQAQFQLPHQVVNQPQPFAQPRPVNPPPVQAPPVIVPADPKEELAKGLNRPKKAGFKPIGFAPISQQAKPNAALKKFFPGEDDDMELSDDSVPAPTTSVRTPAAEQLTQATPTAKPALDPTPPATADSRTPATGPPSTHPTSPPEKVQALPDVGPVDEPAPAPVVPTEKTELYSIVSQVGEGTFGKVYKATNNVSQHLVALKRIRMETERDGFPVTAMREIKLLQSLKHENVVRLYEMVVSNAHVYMVFEYMDHDLTGVLSQNQFSFSEAHLKSLCYQMLAGLAYLHHKGVIHRDIKGSNILVNNRGELKLADFGLARFYHKRRRADYTNRVITLWYRPPELLLGATVYGPEVDMWSAGCIMLELYTKKPVFQGDDEIHQLDVIYKVLGTPTPERWQGVLNLPWYELVKPKEPMPNHFREIFKKWMSPTALDLAEYLLAYDPAARATATQAMDAQYFKEDPAPELPSGLSTLEGEWHELETKRERARRKRETRTGTQ